MGAVDGPTIRYAEWLNDVQRFIPQVVESPATGHIPGALYPRFASVRVFNSHQGRNVLRVEVRILFERAVDGHAGQRDFLFSFCLRVEHHLPVALHGSARRWLNEAFLHPGMPDAKRVGSAERFQRDRPQ